MTGSTPFFPSNSSCNKPVQIECENRWQVYQRLQELGISCQYTMHSPLEVTINHPTHHIQLWSVVQSFTMPRSILVQWLEKCWYLTPPNHDL
jgi:hypothetical protein